ncbi:unnamed protein product [Toxocara canis]|uniref:Syntaxin-6_N domain-containing protein n=1 Tax=Toxocara canis TaxID=6265 RepID=A0A183UMG6_TOXCA|nr:unnamed protein product [Toxocara canis]
MKREGAGVAVQFDWRVIRIGAKEAMSEIDQDVIRKQMVAVVMKELDGLKSEIGNDFLDGSANFLTYKEWSELRDFDANIAAEALDCCSDLMEALRQEVCAKKQLKIASVNVFKAFETTTATLSQLAKKFHEKRVEVEAKRLLSEKDKRRLVSENNEALPIDENVAAINDKTHKENQENAKFDTFDLNSLVARAPQLRSQMGLQLTAEVRDGHFRTKRGETLTSIQERGELNCHTEKGSHPAERSNSSKEERLARALMKVSLNGSLTEERETEEDDSGIVWPRTLKFDDEESRYWQNAYTVITDLDDFVVKTISYPLDAICPAQ